jgi:hypothetical protein
MPSHDGGLHRRRHTGCEQALDRRERVPESLASYDFIMVRLITVQTDFDLSSRQSKRGNESFRQRDSIGRQFGLSTLYTHVVDQSGKIVMNGGLATTEMNCPDPMRQKPIDPAFERRGGWMNSTIRRGQTETAPGIAESRDTKANLRRQLEDGTSCPDRKDF